MIYAAVGIGGAIGLWWYFHSSGAGATTTTPASGTNYVSGPTVVKTVYQSRVKHATAGEMHAAYERGRLDDLIRRTRARIATLRREEGKARSTHNNTWLKHLEERMKVQQKALSHEQGQRRRYRRRAGVGPQQ
jgi:hypothetical protein